MKVQLLSTIPQFLELLDMSKTEDPTFSLMTDVVYLLKINGEIVETVIPQGFKTDFASVPKKFRSIIGNVNKFNRVWLLHDWMYDKRCDIKLTRKESDDILKDLLSDFGMGTIDTWLTYTSVRLFGGSRYRK